MIRTHRAPANSYQTALVQSAKDTLVRVFPDGKTELDRAQEHYLSQPPPTTSYQFTRYGEYHVRLAVDTVFKRKCVFCESNYSAVKAGNVEHYRPKGGVTERNPQFPGYWWLAAHWDNLLASCVACNQVRKHTEYIPGTSIINYEQHIDQEPTKSLGKGNSFPLRGGTWVTDPTGNLGTEDPLLINPCDREPSDHLEWAFDWDRSQPFWDARPFIGFVKPKDVNGAPDPYGDASIKIYGLNRAGLMREREARLLQFQEICKNGFEVIRKAAVADRHERLKETFVNISSFAKPDVPYAGMGLAAGRLFPIELQKYL